MAHTRTLIEDFETVRRGKEGIMTRHVTATGFTVSQFRPVDSDVAWKATVRRATPSELKLAREED